MPRKLGQHFLIRDSVLTRLAEAACGAHTPRVIEVGPGGGALTRHLLTRTDELHAIELDSRLAERLRGKLGSDPRFHLHEGDVLDTDLAKWGPAVVTGNLPYYITSPIIERFLSLEASFERAVFLMQWEVLERIVARPGTREYGYLSVTTQLACDLEVVAKVPPEAFRPPPKVMSGALLFRRKPNPPPNLETIRRFAGWCFTHKRKMLRNNLRPYFGAAIDGMTEASLRAEQLTPEQIVDLCRRLSNTVTPGTGN